MKMRSKFFAATAKLALVILAVGTMLTSCYDSENGDVTKPYVAPNAVYTFVVTVTNGITGEFVNSATVTAGTATCNFVGNGAYEVSVTNDQTGTKMASSVEVKVAATNEYEAASQTVKVADIVNGQAITCYANIIVNPTVFIPEGLEVVETSNMVSTTGSFSGDETLTSDKVGYAPALDIINSSDEPIQVTQNFTVNTGIKYVDAPAETRAINVIDEIKSYINRVEATTVGTEFSTEVLSYSFLLPAKSALQMVSVQYIYDDKTYDFTYGNASYTAKTRRVVSVIFSNTPQLIGLYHGHGHGHGHGGDLNAGGGIFE